MMCYFELDDELRSRKFNARKDQRKREENALDSFLPKMIKRFRDTSLWIISTARKSYPGDFYIQLITRVFCIGSSHSFLYFFGKLVGRELIKFLFSA